MPYVPRRAPSGLVDPSTLPRAPVTTTERPKVPFHGNSQQETKSASSKKGTKMVGKLSMRDWDVDPAKVFKSFFTNEVNFDEHSGLVSYRKPGTR